MEPFPPGKRPWKSASFLRRPASSPDRRILCGSALGIRVPSWRGAQMDVFDLRDTLVGDYGRYAESFFAIRDERIRDHVAAEGGAAGALWPDPPLQLNPSFEPGGYVDELVDEGLLHPRCSTIFRVGKTAEGGGTGLRFHRHQADAIRVARRGRSYVLTTGTGSGRASPTSFRSWTTCSGRAAGQGVKAIIVYPMNALANSQVGELEKFLCHGFPGGRGRSPSPATPARRTTKSARRSSPIRPTSC